MARDFVDLCANVRTLLEDYDRIASGIAWAHAHSDGTDAADALRNDMRGVLTSISTSLAQFQAYHDAVGEVRGLVAQVTA